MKGCRWRPFIIYGVAPLLVAAPRFTLQSFCPRKPMGKKDFRFNR
jgi:hypothetical protein